MSYVEVPPVELAGQPAPHCQHGPTLLFYGLGFLDANTKKRKQREVEPRYYYACSASRDHSLCNFYCSAHRYQMIRAKEPEFLIGQQTVADEYQYLLDRDRVDFCRKCCRVLVDDAEGCGVRNEHLLKYHQTCPKILNYKPTEPWELITLATENAHQAQYFFSPPMVSYLIQEVIRPGRYDSVLCIGCPTIHHEMLLLNSSSSSSSRISSSSSSSNSNSVKVGRKYSSAVKLNTLLLDIDARFGQFYPRDRFIHFNMFNAYFFDTDGRARFQNFLQRSTKLLILIDPPYGGLVQCLANSIREILACSKFATKFPPTMLFFPYFNEHWITKAFGGELKITDFVVTYRNHSRFSNELNSSARIFTNLDRSKLTFAHLNPELYQWCNECTRVVFRMNAHCAKCGECSARDTKPHVHCDQCGRCVKITWSHCGRCGRCHLPTNRCPAKRLDHATTNGAPSVTNGNRLRKSTTGLNSNSNSNLMMKKNSKRNSSSSKRSSSSSSN